MLTRLHGSGPDVQAGLRLCSQTTKDRLSRGEAQSAFSFRKFSIYKQMLVQLSNCIIFQLGLNGLIYISDFICPFLLPYMGVIPNPKMAFIFPISCILSLIFQILIKYFTKCEGKGSFLKSQIKSLYLVSLEKQGFLFSHGVNGPSNYETNTKITLILRHILKR